MNRLAENYMERMKMGETMMKLYQGNLMTDEDIGMLKNATEHEKLIGLRTYFEHELNLRSNEAFVTYLLNQQAIEKQPKR